MLPLDRLPPSRCIAGLLLAVLCSLSHQTRGQEAAGNSVPLPGSDSALADGAVVGTRWVPADVDFARPLYSARFDSAAELANWRLEGGQSATTANGRLLLESRPAAVGAARSSGNHLVYWLEREMPADFLLEFTVCPGNRREGLNIVFFCARGIHGENIFDPALAPRDGGFRQYHSGDLDNYHCSYWAGDRQAANLRKNKGFNLVATGPDRIADGPAGEFQTVRIYKRGGAIRMLVDDIVVIAWHDDGTSHGPALTKPGWIGLRQMGHTARCEYGRFVVYPLKPGAGRTVGNSAAKDPAPITGGRN